MKGVVYCPWCAKPSTVSQWLVVAELIYSTPDHDNDAHWAACPKCGEYSFWGNTLVAGQELQRLEDGMSIM